MKSPQSQSAAKWTADSLVLTSTVPSDWKMRTKELACTAPSASEYLLPQGGTRMSHRSRMDTAMEGSLT